MLARLERRRELGSLVVKGTVRCEMVGLPRSVVVGG